MELRSQPLGNPLRTTLLNCFLFLEGSQEGAFVWSTEQADLAATIYAKTRLETLHVPHVVVTTRAEFGVFKEVALHLDAPFS